MLFDKDMQQYARAYSLYQLLNDLAYSTVTHKYFLDDQRGSNAEISFCCKYNSKKNRITSHMRTEEWNTRFSLIGLKQKFFPDNCQELGEGTLKLAPVICGSTDKLGNEYSEKIIQTIRDEQMFGEWKRKIKQEINKWFVFSDSNKQEKIVTHVLTKMFMAPKYYLAFEENGYTNERKLKYGRKSIFSLMDFDINTNNIVSIACDRDFVEVKKENSNILKGFENIELKYNEAAKKNNENSSKKYERSDLSGSQGAAEKRLFIFRNIVNELIQNNQIYTYDNDEEKCIDMQEWCGYMPIYAEMTELEKSIYELSKINPLEFLTNMIIFSISLQYLDLCEGKLYIESKYKGKSKKEHLLYKLFFEEVKKSKIKVDIGKHNDREVPNLLRNAVEADRVGNCKKKKKYLSLYLNEMRELGRDIYDKNNVFCYANTLLSAMDEDFQRENNLNKEKLLEGVYEYCKSNYHSIKNHRCIQEYNMGLISYAMFIIDNEVNGKDGCLEEIIQILEKVVDQNLPEYNILLAAYNRKKVTQVIKKKNYEEAPMLLKKAYEMYVKAYVVLRAPSVIDRYILPCLKEWSEVREKYNVSVPKVMGKNISEWIEVWNEAKNENGEYEFIQQKFQEKCEEILEDRVAQLEASGVDIKLPANKVNSGELESIVVPDGASDIYIVLGTGRASRTFINSIRDEEDSQIWIVPHEDEIDRIPALVKWYEEEKRIIVSTTGIENILNGSGLELYYLYNKIVNGTMDNSNDVVEAIREYLKCAKRIHFIALDEENKTGNLDAIVKIINDTYIRYYFYNLLSAYTGIKFDFSEVDIVVNSQEQMPWYIDSVLNRFKDEFYLKIKYVSEADLAVRELLTEYPLFLSDISSLKKEGGILEKTGKHNVLILGSHKAVVPALVKSVLQVGGYLRDDIIGGNEYLEKAADHEYKNFEKCIGRYLSVSVIDERATEIERILAYDAPDILKKNLEYVHTVPAFYNYPVQTDDFLTLFSAAYSIDQTQNQDDDTMKQMAAAVAEANYIVVAMDDTEEAMKLAMRIRSMKYRYNVKDEPVISVYTPDRNEDEKIDQFTVGQNIYKDAFNRSYRVNMFGKYQKIYSKENLYDNLLDLISVELHIGDDSKKVEEKKRDYYNGAYNHMSCDCRSLAFIYAMYSVLGTKMIADFSLDDAEDVSAKLKVYNHWSMKLFQKNMDKYLQKYNEIIRKKGYKDALAVLEHHRWNYMLLCNGYVGYIDPAGQADQSIKKTIIEWCRQMVDNKKENKLQVAKVHFGIRPYYLLGDRVNIETLYYLKYAADKVETYTQAGIIKDFLSGNELQLFEENEKEYRLEIIETVVRSSIQTVMKRIKDKKTGKYNLGYPVFFKQDEFQNICAGWCDEADEIFQKKAKKQRTDSVLEVCNCLENEIKENTKFIDDFRYSVEINQEEISNFKNSMEGVKQVYKQYLEDYCDESAIKEVMPNIENLAAEQIKKLDLCKQLEYKEDIMKIRRQINRISNQVKEKLDSTYVYDSDELNCLKEKICKIKSMFFDEDISNDEVISDTCIEEKIAPIKELYKDSEFEEVTKWLNYVRDDLVSKKSQLYKKLDETLLDECFLYEFSEENMDILNRIELEELDELKNSIQQYRAVYKEKKFYEDILGFETEFQLVIALADKLVTLKKDAATGRPISETVQAYNDALDKFKETPFFKKYGIKTVGVDSFEKLMDECAFSIPGFKLTKNRYYDRKYAFDMGSTMQSILERRKEKHLVKTIEIEKSK